MCRLVAYLGHEDIFLKDILENPENSLIKQSHHAKEGITGVNADGFGIAWYNLEIDNIPGIFKSTQPAWNDDNLIHIARKTKSSCFLGHIRASTVGDVNRSNCHPFSFGEYSLVHNGTIRHFDQYKRKLLSQLDEDLFLSVKGSTDSECLFFLIMHFLREDNILENAVKKGINWIVNEQKDQENHFSRINIVVTNGQEIVATRFVSKNEKSLSLKYQPKLQNNKISSLIISSESLDNDDALWHDIPENSYLYINNKTMSLKIEKLEA